VCAKPAAHPVLTQHASKSIAENFVAIILITGKNHNQRNYYDSVKILLLQKIYS
jgi:hypothetical protein